VLRIAYGVFGYGRGHATRAAAVLPDLMARHEVRLFAGGDAYDQLSPEYPVTRIPTLGYVYGRGGRLSPWRTARRNAWYVLDLLLRGPAFEGVCESVADFRPDVIISDAEPWLHRVGRRLDIPRIGFDHFGILVYCRPPIPLGDRLRSRRDVLAYRWLMGRPERVLVSSFYRARSRAPGVRVIPPLLRDEVLRQRPVHGDYLLVYFNRGAHQFTPAVESVLRRVGLPARVYGTSRQGVDGRLDFRPLSNLPFIEDLAGCRAVISTAGNQLVGEAVFLGKPMLVLPEHAVEQRLNGAMLARLGLGQCVRADRFSVATVQAFLARENEFRARLARRQRDGRRAAVATLEEFLHELAGRRPAATPSVAAT